MANTARGEVEIEIGDRKEVIAMTIGALAEMRGQLGIETFEQLSEMLSEPRTDTFLNLMRCLLDGNGVEYSKRDLLRIQPGQAMAWIIAVATAMEQDKDIQALNEQAQEAGEATTEGKPEAVNQAA